LFIVIINLKLTNQLKTTIDFVMNKFDCKDFRIDILQYTKIFS